MKEEIRSKKKFCLQFEVYKLVYKLQLVNLNWTYLSLHILNKHFSSRSRFIAYQSEIVDCQFSIVNWSRRRRHFSSRSSSSQARVHRQVHILNVILQVKSVLLLVVVWWMVCSGFKRETQIWSGLARAVTVLCKQTGKTNNLDSATIDNELTGSKLGSSFLYN